MASDRTFVSASYRLYLLNSRDRTITDAIDIGYRVSDEAAVLEAARFLGAQPAELWDRGRKVHQYNPYWLR